MADTNDKQSVTVDGNKCGDSNKSVADRLHQFRIKYGSLLYD